MFSFVLNAVIKKTRIYPSKKNVYKFIFNIQNVSRTFTILPSHFEKLFISTSTTSNGIFFHNLFNISFNTLTRNREEISKIKWGKPFFFYDSVRTIESQLCEMYLVTMWREYNRGIYLNQNWKFVVWETLFIFNIPLIRKVLERNI